MLRLRQALVSVWRIPWDAHAKLTLSEVDALKKGLAREAQRQQAQLVQLNHTVYHLPNPKTKQPLEAFYTGYASVKEDAYGQDLSKVMRADLSFALALKKLSQATFDGLTV